MSGNLSASVRNVRPVNEIHRVNNCSDANAISLRVMCEVCTSVPFTTSFLACVCVFHGTLKQGQSASLEMGNGMVVRG